MKRRGFTLVELSIVLVIIGLLISGILVGKSIVSATKVQAAIRQFQQFDAAVSNFQIAFKQLPGDSNLTTPAGNNNGHAGSDAVAGGVGVCGTAFCTERMSFWKHLSDTGMIKDSYNNDYSTGNSIAGVNVPKGILSNSFIWGGYYNSNDNGYMGPKGNIYWDMGNGVKDAPEGMDAIAVDTKIDNNDSSTGFVRLWKSGGVSGCVPTDSNCSIMVTMGLSTRQPQDQ